MPSLDDMALFATVVQTGGFTAASRLVGGSKQNISERIARLEEELGVRLLERTTRLVRPTEAGEAYYEHCSALLARAQEANQAAKLGQAVPSGVLRIASTVEFGHAYVVDIVADYLRDWPHVRVDLVLVDRPVNLIDEGFDLAFWIDKPRDWSVVARPIGPANAFFVASRSYIARHGEPRSPEAWKQARCIAWVTRRWMMPDGKPMRIKPILTANTAQAALQAALRGVGIARLPGPLIEPYVRRGDLVPLFGGTPARSTEFHIVYPSRKHLPAKVRRFIDLATKRIRPTDKLIVPKAQPRRPRVFTPSLPIEKPSPEVLAAEEAERKAKEALAAGENVTEAAEAGDNNDAPKPEVTNDAPKPNEEDAAFIEPVDDHPETILPNFNAAPTPIHEGPEGDETSSETPDESTDEPAPPYGEGS